MKYGVLSDVHSNLEALDAALGALKRRGAEGWIVLGDLVGYGADPNACLSRLAKLEPAWLVLGNHDAAVLGRMELTWFNPVASEALEWTRKVLNSDSRRLLETLSERIETKSFTAVHGSPRSPLEEYLITPGQFLDNLEHFKVSPCFVGHSHLPLYFESLGGERVGGDIVDGESKFRAGISPCVINPGSIGQPRDMDSRASCGLYDGDTKTFEWLRVDYPIEKTQGKIREAGLPEYLAARLERGR